MNKLIVPASIILIILFLNVSSAQEDNIDLVQYKKGFICDINVGTPIGDVLYDGEIVQVEKHSGEGSSYFIFDLKVLNCGIVKAYAGDQWTSIFRLSTDNPKYKVIGGGQVGMTLSKLEKLYPLGELIILENSNSPYTYHFYLPDELGVFEFEGEEIRSKCGDKFPNCEELKENLKAVRFVTY